MEIITAFGFACIATMAFAVLFQAPKKIVLIDGVIGAIGWVVFIYLRHELGYTSFVSNFCATISLALASAAGNGVCYTGHRASGAGAGHLSGHVCHY